MSENKYNKLNKLTWEINILNCLVYVDYIVDDIGSQWTQFFFYLRKIHWFIIICMSDAPDIQKYNYV